MKPRSHKEAILTPWQSYRTRHRGAAPAALICCLAIVVSACSTPSSTPGASAPVASASAPATSSAPSGEKIVFGDLHPFTGQYASVGTHSFAGAKSAEACINDAGGLLGRPLHIATGDTVGDPADAVPALNKLLSVDNAVAIIGPGGLEIGAAQPILDSHKIPFMFEGGLSAVDQNTDPLLWRDTPSDSQEGVAMALYAISKGYKTAALVFSTIQSAQDFKDPVKNPFIKAGGRSLPTSISRRANRPTGRRPSGSPMRSRTSSSPRWSLARRARSSPA